ncbi:MAG TPA: hypothetical protein PK280_20190 [Planctomycetota bacterium]|nr:hypothetical protein [Planctomycetota bacterium]
MIRFLVATGVAVGLAALAAGCGGDSQVPTAPTGKGQPPKGGGPVVIMPDEAPRIVVEAEAATDVQPHFKVLEDSEASGGKSLTVPSKGCNGEHHQHIAKEETDPERTKGSAELAFRAEKDGEYILWIRKWWCCSCGDSFTLQLDDGKPFVFGNDGTTPRHWAWLAYQEAGEPRKFRLSAGPHKLVFRNRGESGFRIDQVLWAADPKFVPQGKELAPAAPAVPAVPKGPTGG